MVRLLLLIVPLAALAGCKTENPDYCKNFPGTMGCSGEPMNGGTCSVNTDCVTTGFPICDTSMNEGTCVQCTMADSHICTEVTPICTKQGKCAACTNHADCTQSHACMPNGSCAKVNDVAYVDGTNGMDMAPCTMDMPCTKIDKAAAMKNIVKVSGIVKDRCSLMNVTATILAEQGAKLMPSNNGVAFEAKGMSNVQVYDLQISNAQGGSSNNVMVSEMANLTLNRVRLTDAPGNGALLTGGHLTCIGCVIATNALRGIDASSAGTITIARSTISDNVNGGIRISDDVVFQIVGNVIYHNGQTDKNAGAISVAVNPKTPGAPPNQLDFNTIVANTSITTAVQGVNCAMGTTMKASNNIIWDNGVAGAGVQANTDGQCGWEYSDVGPAPLVAGSSSNMSMPPKFASEATGDLRLTASSPVRGMADPSADLAGLAAQDIDGQIRTSRADMGAYQFRGP